MAAARRGQGKEDVGVGLGCLTGLVVSKRDIGEVCAKIRPIIAVGFGAGEGKKNLKERREKILPRGAGGMWPGLASIPAIDRRGSTAPLGNGAD
jgi:hypothetical protein